MLHGIVEPSCSAWSSLCLFTDEAHGEDHFCTDSQKVNEVTKPDCYHFSRMKDCVDWVDGPDFPVN